MAQKFSPTFCQITVEELAHCLPQSPELQLLDVREPWELEAVSLPEFTNLPLSTFSEWSEQIHARLDPHKETLVLCHHGMRSAQMCQWLVSCGFTQVKNITGGIEAYAVLVDPTLPRY
jgi:rhodanese-related sulfurtransferase